MTVATLAAKPHSPFRPKHRLGFNTRVSFNDDAGPATGLRDGMELFRQAEKLGYQSGWVYQRHFDHYLSSPLPFFAAVGQHTRHITLGTAVIPMRYQDPILLAEAAGTTDLLVGGRLEIAISTGANGAFDAVFGEVETDARTEAKRRQHRFLSAVSGEVLHTVTEPGQGAPQGSELRATPHSPGLRSRIRQGSASLASAIQAAELGIGLISGTVLHGGNDGEAFGHYQARIIDAYRSHWERIWKTAPPAVAVAASILVATDAQLRDKYSAYDLERRTKGIAASRPKGALQPPPQSAELQISPVFQGTPDQVIEALSSDPGLAAADEVILFLPPAFELTENLQLLKDFAETVAPELGWSPASSQ